MTSKLQKLAAEVLRLSTSSENQRRLIERHTLVSGGRAACRPPVYVRLNRPYLQARTGVNLKNLIHDPEAYLELELMTKIIKFTEFDEDTPLFPDVMLQFGTAWDLTLCGIPWVEVGREEPWIGQPILGSADEVDLLHVPVDFDQVGMMPLTLPIYEDIRRILGDRIPVHFPDWLAGPTRIVQKLRGEESFFLDLYDNPTGVHKMFVYATRVRRAFEAYRARLTRTGPGPGEFYYWEFKTMANDEVNAELLSPQHYREFIYPYDLEYCRDYPRVYFHGSGVFTPYFDKIATLPNLRMIEISDWSDLGEANRVLGDKLILERTFLQTERAFTGDHSTKTNLLGNLVKAAGGSSFYFILNVDNQDQGIEGRIHEWVQLSRQAIERHLYPISSGQNNSPKL